MASRLSAPASFLPFPPRPREADESISETACEARAPRCGENKKKKVYHLSSAHRGSVLRQELIIRGSCLLSTPANNETAAGQMGLQSD